MKILQASLLIGITLFSFVGLNGAETATLQSLTASERFYAKQMLHIVIDDIKDFYFDKQYLKSINLDEKKRKAMQEIDKAETRNQLYGIIGQLFLEFDEVGTYFMSPSALRFPDYGFQWDIIGERCFITYVDPESDAERVGLRRGDQVLEIHRFTPSRNNAWKIRYTYSMIRPLSNLPIRIRRADNSEVIVSVKPKFINEEGDLISFSDISRYMRKLNEQSPNCYMSIDNVLVVKNIQDVGCARQVMESINFKGVLSSVRPRRVSLQEGQRSDVTINRESMATDENVQSERGRLAISRFNGYRGIIFDLRDCCNADYDIDNTAKLLSNFIDKKTKLADLVRGNKVTSVYLEPLKGKDNLYKGAEILILVNSQTRSIGEIIARTMQVEGIGKVVGDKTRGSVRLSRHVYDSQHVISTGHSTSLIFLSSITTTEVIMFNGEKIQGIGVIPDIPIVPSVTDIINGYDIVMLKAMQLYGVNMRPAQVGRMFSSMVTNWMYRYL